MDALLIIISIVMTLLIIAINIYLLILYSHTDDAGWGTAIYCKILVVMGLTLFQAPALLVPLDVANKSAVDSNSIDMIAFWYAVYITTLIFIALLLPYAIFLYETDVDDSWKKRLLTALAYTGVSLLVTLVLLFASWAGLRYVDLPVQEVILTVAQVSVDDGTPITIIPPVINNTDFEMEATFAVYIIAILSFFGWILLVIFGGVGIFALPIDMINQFRNRPQARTTKQMKDTRQNLVNAIVQLQQQGEKLKTQDNQLNENEHGFFQKWKLKRKVGNSLNEFKAKYQALSEEYEIFNLQLEYGSTNPLIPILKLIVGILFLITSILWIIQIIFGNIARAALDRPLIPFLNEFLIELDESGAGFIGTAIFAYLCLYMMWCVQKGNIKFGIRIPFCCRFHPMKQNQTWMNSFLFNIITLLIAAAGVVQLCISSFPTYTRNTEIYAIIGIQINYMRFYTAFYDNNVFPIMFIIWAFLTLIYQLYMCNKKPSYMDRIQAVRDGKN